MAAATGASRGAVALDRHQIRSIKTNSTSLRVAWAQTRRSSSKMRANAPAEGSTAPVSRDDLVAYLASGCKPRDRWRIGTEHEKLGFNLTDNTRCALHATSLHWRGIDAVDIQLHSNFLLYSTVSRCQCIPMVEMQSTSCPWEPHAALPGALLLCCWRVTPLSRQLLRCCIRQPQRIIPQYELRPNISRV
jgi:hypothetical protein